MVYGGKEVEYKHASISTTCYKKFQGKKFAASADCLKTLKI